jgi:hypothetical protein
VKTNQSFVRVLSATVDRLVGFLFGRISWSAPPWLAWCGAQVLALSAFLKARPKSSAAVVLVVAALAIGSWQYWLWWESHRPRKFAYNPVRQVVVSISQPPGAVAPGAPDKDLTPSPLRIAFSGAPVAPLEKIGKEATDAVTLDPAIPGKWTTAWPLAARCEIDGAFAPRGAGEGPQARQAIHRHDHSAVGGGAEGFFLL